MGGSWGGEGDMSVELGDSLAAMVAALARGVVLGLSAGFAPGPLSALVISQTLQHGRGEGIKVALAPLLTDLPIIGLSLFVLARLAGFRALLGVITVAGGIYLLHLARENFRITGLAAGSAAAAPQSLLRGTLANVLNPSPYLFWLTVGAPTVVKAWATGAGAAVSFLGGFYACLIGAKVFIAIVVGTSTGLLTGRRYAWLMRGLGVVLAVMAVLLFRDGLRLAGVF